MHFIELIREKLKDISLKEKYNNNQIIALCLMQIKQKDYIDYIDYYEIFELSDDLDRKNIRFDKNKIILYMIEYSYLEKNEIRKILKIK